MAPSGQTRLRPRRGRRGMFLIDAAIGALAVALILLGVVSAIVLQATTAGQTLRRSRARLLLEGELEALRSAPAAALAPTAGTKFTPLLGVPAALDGVRWRREVERTGEGLLRVRLVAEGLPLGDRREAPLTVEGTLDAP